MFCEFCDVALLAASTFLYVRIGHVALAARIAATAIVASADIDVERSRLYLDLILISLSKSAPEVPGDTMKLTRI